MPEGDPPENNPLAPKPNMDSSSPERGQWWHAAIDQNRIISEHYEDAKVTEPPATTEEFVEWVGQTATDIATKIRRNPDNYSDWQHSPELGARAIYNYAQALNAWNTSEIEGRRANSLVEVGRIEAYEEMLSEMGLGADAQFVRSGFQRIPAFKSELLKRRGSDAAGLAELPDIPH